MSLSIGPKSKSKPKSKSMVSRHVSHNNVVTSVAFSPDGQTVASGSWDGTVKLWDVLDGKPKLKKTFRGEWDEVEAVAFSPDGSAIAAVGTGFDRSPFSVVTVWALDATRGRTVVREFGKIDALAFAPDGVTLATGIGDRRVVTLRDVASGQERLQLPGHRGLIWSVAYSPDGSRLAVGCGIVPAMAEPAAGVQAGEICLWDLEGPTPSMRARLEGHGHGIISVAFSPDGRTLASGGFDRNARLWDAASGRERATLNGHLGWVASVAFSPDSTLLATGSHDQTIKLWDTTTGHELTTLRGHNGNVYSVAFAPDGTRLASGSLDGTVRIWDLD